MKFRFQRTPLDILLCVWSTVVLFVALFLLNEGVIPGFLLVGFFPGYVVVASLYPNHGGLSWMERLLLSIVLSIALLPLLALEYWSFSVPAADQPQWGQAWSRNMVSSERSLPDSFDPATGKNIKWSARLGTELGFRSRSVYLVP